MKYPRLGSLNIAFELGLYMINVLAPWANLDGLNVAHLILHA